MAGSQTRRPVPRIRALVAVLFLLSGACTLIYQIIWLRLLVLVLGVSVAAVSTVLSAFMAGLALGSIVVGRFVDRSRSSLRIYALLELGIGLYALIFPYLVTRLDDLHVLAYRSLGSGSYTFLLARFLLGFLVLLIPTTLMGATLPVLGRWAVSQSSRVGSGVGRLYAINTFGAAGGCLLAAFVMVEQFGVRGATYVAAGANLLIAALAFHLSRGGPEEAAPATAPLAPVTEARDEPWPADRVARWIFWGYAVSGFTALGYEVVWSRLLSVALRLTTTQSLSVILFVFIFGLGLGGWIGARLVDRWSNPARIFASAQILLGLCGLASIAAFGLLPRITSAVSFVPGWAGHLLRIGAAAFTILLLPTCLMGLLFPLAARAHARGWSTLGRRIGSVYAVNTTGALCGAFAGGFVLIPLLGTQGSLQLLAATNLLLGAAILARATHSGTRRHGLAIAGCGLPLLALAALIPSGFLARQLAPPHSTVLHYDEGVAGTVTVLEYPGGERLLRVNGAGEVPTDDKSIRTFRLLGNLPLVLHPDPQEVLVIAFGGGITLSSVELHEPRSIDCVEVAPAVFEAARYFVAYNHSVFERLGGDRIHVIPDDGRNHVLRTDKLYDVIISDSTHPGTADSWVLYTEDFYRLCRKRLHPGGMFAQWVPLHGLTADDYRIILRTVRRIFPHASLWITRGYSVVLGTEGPLDVDWSRLSERLGRPSVAADLAQVGLGDPTSFLSTLVLDEAAIERYAGPGPINSDDRPHLSYWNPQRGGTGSGLPVILSLLPHLSESPRIPLVHATHEDQRALARRQQARRHVLLGDIAIRLGERAQALEQSARALAIDPGAQEAHLVREEAQKRFN